MGTGVNVGFEGRRRLKGDLDRDADTDGREHALRNYLPPGPADIRANDETGPRNEEPGERRGFGENRLILL